MIKTKKRLNHKGIYFIADSAQIRVKIGYTIGNISVRINTLQNMCPVRLVLVLFAEVDNPPEYEKILHYLFAAENSHGEWFYYSDRIKEFIKLCESCGFLVALATAAAKHYPKHKDSSYHWELRQAAITGIADKSKTLHI